MFSFGTIPDILMGKKPKDAILDNLKMAALVGTGMAATSAFAPAAGATGAASSAGSSMASSLPAFNPMTGTYANAASLPGTTGFTESLRSFNAAVKPFMDAGSSAMQVNGMLQGDRQMPVAQSQLPQRMPVDFSGILGTGQVAQLQQKRMARRGLLG